MHSCRQFENRLVDLLFDDMDTETKRRLLSEMKDCANCAGQYRSLSDALHVFEHTADAALPPANYWPQYNAKLREQLLAPVQATSEAGNVRAPFWKSLLTMRLPVPVPIAAALIIGFVMTSALAFRGAHNSQANVAPPASPVETIKIVEVPVIQEKIVTRVVYVEKKQSPQRDSRPPQAVAANASETGDAAVASSRKEKETGFFTRANLTGFQPANEMKIRVIKRNSDEK